MHFHNITLSYTYMYMHTYNTRSYLPIYTGTLPHKITHTITHNWSHSRAVIHHNSHCHTPSHTRALTHLYPNSVSHHIHLQTFSGMIDAGHCAWLFTWVVGISTQAHMFIQQAPCQLNHHPRPYQPILEMKMLRLLEDKGASSFKVSCGSLSPL